ncbi:protein phosphatase 1 regulatory subunit 12B-like isoform X1 [Ornithodoros turicata]|uniref:protein phosphatase 1 regulatory subunit 12B-like isoform X1 n=1 Tax=Ornithodoros turicata TaxID=34597 RepID=UPI0031391D15
MSLESRPSNALFKRKEQLKRWEDSETNRETTETPANKLRRIKFSDGCVFLAACAAGDTDEVERLLSRGADINTSNVDGLTALHQACIDDNMTMVEFLVEHGCNLNLGDNEGWTPLHATASCGFVSIARYLIENGANVALANNDGDLPIDIAECEELEELLQEEIDRLDVDCESARTEEERVMLEDAKQMLNNPRVQDKIHPKTGATSLHVAAAKGYHKIMSLLIQAGVDLNAQDNEGWTPLHAAAHWGQKTACRILAEHLANMDITNYVGQTCFDIADPEVLLTLEELRKKQASMQKERPEIQEILERKAQKPPLKRRTSVMRMSLADRNSVVDKDKSSERSAIEAQYHLAKVEEDVERSSQEREINSKEEITRKNEVNKANVLLDGMVEPSLAEKPKEPPSNDIDEVTVALRKLRRTSPQPPQDVEVRTPNPPTQQPLKEVTPPLPEKKPSPPPVEERKKEPSPPEETVTLRKRARAVPDNNEESSASTTENPAQGAPKRTFVLPVRDEESETQRKAHAKRVRETRRSTQGVTLEDLKSAEQQLLKKQQEREEHKEDKPPPSQAAKSATDDTAQRLLGSSKEKEEQPPTVRVVPSSPEVGTTITLPIPSRGRVSPRGSEDASHTVTIPFRPRASPFEEPEPKDTSPPSPEAGDMDKDDSRNNGTVQSAAIQRRRRPKRRSTGVVYLEGETPTEPTTGQASTEASDQEKLRLDKQDLIGDGRAPTDPLRGRSGSTGSIADSLKSESESRQSDRLSTSTGSLVSESELDYKKLYEDLKESHERLKTKLIKTEDELDSTKRQLEKALQNNRNSLSDTEKRERRAMERKMSEMEEELKVLEQLKTENVRLREENGALIRVISKLSK